MLRTTRWGVPVLFVALLAAFAAALWGSYRESFPATGLYRLSGVFEHRWGETMILVKHDAVPGFMQEMGSMALFAESPKILDQAALRPGDRVRFTVRQLPDKLLIVEIRKVR